MYSLKVENEAGEVLDLSTSKDFTVYKISGLTPAHATINQSANSTQDGMSINSARLDSRNIVINMAIEGDIEANRIKMYQYFNTKRDVTLYFSNDTRDVCIKGKVETIECDMFTKREKAQISIICPRPYFKSIDYLVTSFSNVLDVFEFPFSISEAGIELSVIAPNVRKSIINTGEADTGVIIELFATGTVVNPILYDVLNKTFMKLNFTMLQSDKLVINTNPGEKSIKLIRGGVSSNALGYMSPDSTWFLLVPGDNVYTYDCESGAENLQIKFTTSILYGGV